MQFKLKFLCLLCKTQGHAINKRRKRSFQNGNLFFFNKQSKSIQHTKTKS